jgi:transaldolase
MIVKIAATRAGIPAIEEATYRGISINATVSFTLPQAIAVAEAVERGLKRREAEGLDISTMGPVCTLMVGRLDDWLKVLHDKHNLSVDPGYLEWAGVAVFKKAYKIYREPAATACACSPRPSAITCTGASSSAATSSSLRPAPGSALQRERHRSHSAHRQSRRPAHRRNAARKFPDFARAYTENGLTPAEFDTFGSTRRTLRQFIAAVAEMNSIVRDIILPNPDTE